MNFKTPLCSLIENWLKFKGLRRVEFVKQCGYKNLSKGLRKLEEWLEAGKIDPEIYARFSKELDINEKILKDAIEKTQEIGKTELEIERLSGKITRIKNFRHYIYINSESSRPSPIFIAAICGVGSFKHLYLAEDFIFNKLEDQLIEVKKVILQYTAEDKDCGPFGKATGFKYYYTSEDYFEFSLEGELINSGEGATTDGKAVLFLK